MIINMPFKPKAQLLLQLGEQLIKSESVAVLELIKNSYDADATKVTVTMNDIDMPSIGYIEISDNGTGMDLDTVRNIWMEPGNTHKRNIVNELCISPLGRLPIGEKGIGRFGVHKLGKKIEMITRSKDSKEVRVSIDWRAFDTAEYLDDVNIFIEEIEPTLFTADKTGTRLYISDLSTEWTRGMLRDVSRAITTMSSPFDTSDAFRVQLRTNRKEWLNGLKSFRDIKDYALYTGHIEITGNQITSFSYEFKPFSQMIGLKGRKFNQDKPEEMNLGRKNPQDQDAVIDLRTFDIGIIKIDLLVFDRDSSIRARFITDKKTYGQYLDENGGIRVFRDGIRVFNYGEPDNDWLGLDIKRVNTPGRYLSNNIVLGAVNLDRASSTSLKEKSNREGFIENEAYRVFQSAVSFAIERFTTQRNIDKTAVRIYMSGGPREPIVADISELRKEIALIVRDENDRRKIDVYLKRIETDFSYLKEMYLKTANAGMSYGAIIHEIEKIINELSLAVKKEKTSVHIMQLAQHLSHLVESYADLLRNKSKSKTKLKEVINQAVFSLQYRLKAHNVNCELMLEPFGESIIFCSMNLVVGSMINIIDNSIYWTEYSKVSNKSICIKPTYEINGAPAIVIADNGCGFKLSPEDMIKPFVTMKPNGLGLGLNIVNEIMLSQGGSLVFPEFNDVCLPKKYENGAVIALVFPEEKK